MKSKIIKTALWVIGILFVLGAFKVLYYEIGMYYSNLAPKQFDDDSAYAQMRFHTTVTYIAGTVEVLLIILILYKIIRVWQRPPYVIK